MKYEVVIERIDKKSDIFGRIVNASSRRIAVAKILKEWAKEHSGERWKELSIRVYAR